jgi:hypothetical protein
MLDDEVNLALDKNSEWARSKADWTTCRAVKIMILMFGKPCFSLSVC